ncbi:MAG: biotin--[acetyl-CoA-carboxylase] ligase [Marinicellaceae bacterium]
MVNQKNQSLEALFKLICQKPQLTIDAVVQQIELPENKLRSLISELCQMGLDVSYQPGLIVLNQSVDLIDVHSIESQLKSCGIELDIHYHFISKSTNVLARNNHSNALYMADYQSNGKGRQSKKWLTPLGQSIAMSLSHRFDCGINKLSGLNIAIGVSILQTLKQYGADTIGLKWPNDLVDTAGKVAGILIEVSGNDKTCQAIIGIGINWNIQKALFALIDQPCSNVNLLNITRTQFIVELIKNIKANLKEFEQNRLAKILPIWNENDVYIHKEINLLTSSETESAIYKGINDKGLLLVEKNNKISAVASGEVSVRALH